MKNLVLTVVFLIIGLQIACGQINAKRIEFPIQGTDLESFNIPIGDQGVIVLSQLNKQSFNIRKFSTDLEQIWSNNTNLESNLDYVTYSFDGTVLSLLFSRFRSNSYVIFRVLVHSGEITKYQIYSVDRIEISNFKALNYSLFIGGMVNNQPIILFTNLKERKTRILPAVVKGQAEIQSMDLDTLQQQINVTYSVGSKAKDYQLIIKSFDEDGNQIGQVYMNPSEEFAMMNGKLNQINDSLQVIVGTYGQKNSIGSSRGPSSQGLYFNSFIDGNIIKSTYYSFTKFTDFFNFLTPKQKERQEKKIKDKEVKGEDLRLDYRLLMHDIIKNGENYIIIAEAFYPDYKYNNYSPFGGSMLMGGLGGFYSPYWTMMNPYRWGYGNYGMYSPFSSYYSPWGYRGYNSYSNQQQFDGWIYTHAVVAELDKDGKLLWDHCIDLNDGKESKLIQKIKASVVNNTVYLSYHQDDQIITKSISNNGKEEALRVQEVTPEDKLDKVRRTVKSEINYWYGPYFIASGYQTISNQEEGRRNVFFLNKIQINP
jgi:hypothetical protein